MIQKKARIVRSEGIRGGFRFHLEFEHDQPLVAYVDVVVPVLYSITDHSAAQLLSWRDLFDRCIPDRVRKEKIHAIKWIREKTGCTLKDAKDYLERNLIALGFE